MQHNKRTIIDNGVRKLIETLQGNSRYLPRYEDFSGTIGSTCAATNATLINNYSAATYEAQLCASQDEQFVEMDLATTEQEFVDLGQDAFISEDDRHFRQLDLGYASEVEKEIAFPLDMLSLANKALTGALLLILFFGAYAGFLRWQIHEQTMEGISQLQASKLEVEQYIRRNGYFPNRLEQTGVENGIYQVRLDNERIVLTYNNKAAKQIRGGELYLQAKHIPQLGLSWECHAGVNFQARYLPARCY